MKKLIILLIALLIISTCLLSGCTDSSYDNIDYHSFDYSKVEYDFTVSYNRGNIDFYLEFIFPYQHFGQGTMEGCEIRELNYVLYGNGHYVGGQKLTELVDGDNVLTWQGFGLFNGWFDVYELNSSYHKDKKDWLIYIHPELKSAMENETMIKWTITGEFSFYTPDGSELIKVPFEDLTCYQSEFA